LDRDNGFAGIANRSFGDRSKEWANMNGGERYQFLIPITIASYVGTFLLLLGLDGMTFVHSKRSINYGDLIFFILFSIPGLVWFAFRFVQVIRSGRRYNGSAQFQ
jgi:hypothetical protein